jgi:hypothetical protein
MSIVSGVSRQNYSWLEREDLTYGVVGGNHSTLSLRKG